MKGVGKFYSHLLYFTAASFILWPFGTYICVNLVHFISFGIMHKEKSGNPAARSSAKKRNISRPEIFLENRKRCCCCCPLIERSLQVVAVGRVARFLLVQNTKTGKIYQITIKYTEWPHYTYTKSPITRPFKIYPIHIFSFKNMSSGNPGCGCPVFRNGSSIRF
jgi:hypothetical protein